MGTIRSYAGPHKGLRYILSQFIIKAGQTESADPDQLKSLKQLGRDTFTLLNNHVHHENESTLAHLEQKAKGASQHDLQDHEELEIIQNALEQKLTKLDSTASAEDMHMFYLDASHFYALYLLHIHHEETVTECLLQKYFTDEELMAQHQEVVKNIDLPTLLLWMQCIIPAQTEEEALKMLGSIKANAPADVFESALAAIKPNMNEESYLSLISKL